MNVLHGIIEGASYAGMCMHTYSLRYVGSENRHKSGDKILNYRQTLTIIIINGNSPFSS